MRRGKDVMASALAVAPIVAAAIAILILGSSHRAPSHGFATPQDEPLPLPRGGAWYSETLDTSASTVANGGRKFPRELVQKWVTWQGNEFQKDSAPGLHLGPGGYTTGDSEPGFGNWDAVSVHTLPVTVAGVLRLLKSGRLEEGQTDRAERRTPLIWLAQLSAMLADDPNSPTARRAAFRAIYSFPGLRRLGPVRDPRGRAGIAVAEDAGNLHPLLVAAGPGCKSPYGGAGCVGVARPAGRYELEMIFDPRRLAILAVRTVALDPIPVAWIKTGTVIYEVSYLQGKLVKHPHIPPAPRPAVPTIESVPRRLVRVSGRQVTVGWGSGTCDPGLKPNPIIEVVETGRTVTLGVLIQVVKAENNVACAGVALGGTVSTKVAYPLGQRKLAHGVVTDHDR
jgi:hypothetical protein